MFIPRFGLSFLAAFSSVLSAGLQPVKHPVDNTRVATYCKLCQAWGGEEN